MSPSKVANQFNENQQSNFVIFKVPQSASGISYRIKQFHLRHYVIESDSIAGQTLGTSMTEEPTVRINHSDGTCDAIYNANSPMRNFVKVCIHHHRLYSSAHVCLFWFARRRVHTGI